MTITVRLAAVLAAIGTLICAPLGLVTITGLGLAAHGDPDCLAALAQPPSPPDSPPDSPDSQLDICDGGDGQPGNGHGGIPAGWQPPTDAQQATAVAFALAQLGEPYVFGATGPNSWDCSGLTMRAWQAAGVTIPRTTFTQVTTGIAIPDLTNAQPGDLLFIPGSDGTRTRPGHVGLHIGTGGDGRPYLVQAPHTGDVVKVTPVASWAGQIVAIRRPGTALM